MKKQIPGLLRNNIPLILAFIWSFSIILTSCTGAKKLMKDASTLETGGLHTEALTIYDNLYTNYAKADALVGMKRVAQRILDKKLSDAQMQCMAENFDASLASYDDAISFYSSYQHLDLHTTKPIEQMRGECKGLYIDKLYKQAEDYVKDDDFENAHIFIQRIFRLDRNNQKAVFLDMMCEILPNYRSGEIAAEKGLWREAYVYFNEVCLVDAGFRDAKKRRDEALEKGTFSIVYKVNDNRFVNNIYENAQGTLIKGKLLNAKNPFVELLEREDLNIVLQEQQETMSPEYEESTGPESGKLKRARFILSGEFVSLSYDDNQEVRSRCDCWNTFKIDSDKVDCYQLTNSASLQASFKYKLLDAETGKLYRSDIVHFDKSDQGKRFTYEIQQKISLISPTGLKDHEVDLSRKIVPDNDPLISENEMMNEMYEFIAKAVVKDVEQFRP